MEEKIKELAKKYDISPVLLKEAIQMEKNNLVFTDNRRRLLSQLEDLIIKHSN